MKKIIGILAVLFALTCSAFAGTKGVMLRENGPLWALTSDGTMRWESKSGCVELPAGTVVDVVSEDIVVATMVTYDGTTYPNIQFYKVKYKNKELYARTSQFAIGSNVTVIASDTVLFTKPQLQSFRNALIEAGSIVVIGNSVTAQNINFTEITFFDTLAYENKTRYVVNSAISQYGDDLKAIQLYNKAIANKDDPIRNEFLSSAMSLNTSSEISDMISEEYYK